MQLKQDSVVLDNKYDIFIDADPVQDHLTIVGVEDGWLRVDDEVLEDYYNAKTRMAMCVDATPMLGYWNSYLSWAKDN